MKALQYIYTACRDNGSFSVYSCSEGVTAEEKQEIFQYMQYKRPNNLPQFPNEENPIDVYPVSCAFFPLKSGRICISQASYVGRVYDNNGDKRGGNYLIHALIFSSIDLICSPVQLFEENIFKSELSEREQADNVSPPPLPIININKYGTVFNFESLGDFIKENDNYDQKFKKLMRAFMIAQASDTTLFINDDPFNILYWISLIELTVPSRLAKKIWFNTYINDYEEFTKIIPAGSNVKINKQFRCVGVMPEYTDFNYEMEVRNPRIIVCDLINNIYSNTIENNVNGSEIDEYTDFLIDELVYNCDEFRNYIDFVDAKGIKDYDLNIPLYAVLFKAITGKTEISSMWISNYLSKSAKILTFEENSVLAAKILQAINAGLEISPNNTCDTFEYLAKYLPHESYAIGRIIVNMVIKTGNSSNSLQIHNDILNFLNNSNYTSIAFDIKSMFYNPVNMKEINSTFNKSPSPLAAATIVRFINIPTINKVNPTDITQVIDFTTQMIEYIIIKSKNNPVLFLDSLDSFKSDKEQFIEFLKRYCDKYPAQHRVIAENIYKRYYIEDSQLLQYLENEFLHQKEYRNIGIYIAYQRVLKSDNVFETSLNAVNHITQIDPKADLSIFVLMLLNKSNIELNDYVYSVLCKIRYSLCKEYSKDISLLLSKRLLNISIKDLIEFPNHIINAYVDLINRLVSQENKQLKAKLDLVRITTYLRDMRNERPRETFSLSDEVKSLSAVLDFSVCNSEEINDYFDNYLRLYIRGLKKYEDGDILFVSVTQNIADAFGDILIRDIRQIYKTINSKDAPTTKFIRWLSVLSLAIINCQVLYHEKLSLQFRKFLQKLPHEELQNVILSAEGMMPEKSEEIETFCTGKKPKIQGEKNVSEPFGKIKNLFRKNTK